MLCYLLSEDVKEFLIISLELLYNLSLLSQSFSKIFLTRLVFRRNNYNFLEKLCIKGVLFRSGSCLFTCLVFLP